MAGGRHALDGLWVRCMRAVRHVKAPISASGCCTTLIALLQGQATTFTC